MTLHIQAHLRSGGTEADLLTRYAIKAKRHGTHPNLVLYKYNQIDSPFAEPIVRECRGIVLDEARDWAVVSRAFDKFFNHGEGHAAEIDWSTARVQEKVDGSLCTLYRHAGEWHVATTGTPDASGDLHLAGRSFASMFWEVLGSHDAALPTEAGDHCYFFELTSPFNRIVVRYTEPALTLLGARHIESGQEVRPRDAVGWLGAKVPIRIVPEYPLGSFAEIAASFEAISPLSQEGYVVCDAAFRRVKVKHPGYVALHHAKEGLSAKAFVEIARKGETSEVLVAFPEFAPMLDEARARLDAIVGEVEGDYARLHDIAEQKAFALEAVKTRCSAALFQLRAGKAPSVREFFAKQPIETLMRQLGYKDAAAGAVRP